MLWKVKATQRKALTIRIREFTVSRNRHRHQAEQLQAQVHDWQQQLDHARHQAAQLQARGAAAARALFAAALASTPSVTPCLRTIRA